MGINGHPNVYINWEHRFNYNAYNLDLSNAEKAIQACKNQIYEESNRFKQVISNSVADYNKQEVNLSQLKSIYNNYKKEYTDLCKKNADLNVKINTQIQTLTSV